MLLSCLVAMRLMNHQIGDSILKIETHEPFIILGPSDLAEVHK